MLHSPAASVTDVGAIHEGEWACIGQLRTALDTQLLQSRAAIGINMRLTAPSK